LPSPAASTIQVFVDVDRLDQRDVHLFSAENGRVVFIPEQVGTSKEVPHQANSAASALTAPGA
jgi:hypothetical protein